MIKIIILVGADCTGKDTIRKAVERKTNYKYFVLSRLTDSFVYKKLFDREEPSDSQILNFEINLNKIADVYLIYLTADTKILMQRIKKKRDKETADFINKSKKLFVEDYLKKTYFKHIVIDTGKNNVYKCVDRIVKFVEEK